MFLNVETSINLVAQETHVMNPVFLRAKTMPAFSVGNKQVNRAVKEYVTELALLVIAVQTRAKLSKRTESQALCILTKIGTE